MASVDPQAASTLIPRFAPLVWIHPEETSRPSAVATVLNSAYLVDANLNKILPPPITAVQLAQTAGTNQQSNYSLYFDGQDAIEANWPPDPNYVLRGLPYTNGMCTAPCYAHIRSLSGSFAAYAITYMFFNPFNGSTAINGYIPTLGVHVGDWEHITVLVSLDGNSVVAVYFSRHGTGTWLDASECAFQADQQNSATHVVVYSACGSHASYATSGPHLNPEWSVLAIDYTSAGVQWQTWNSVQNVGDTGSPTPGNEWIGYTGYWGTTRGQSGQGTSPTSPSFQRWWNQESGESRWTIQPGALGPSGGSTSTAFTKPLPAGSQITGFIIWAGEVVNAIQFLYTGSSGPGTLTIGGSNHSPQPRVVALASGEYIVGLSGRYGNSIDLLTIITMQGNGQTNHYTFGQTGGQIDFSYTILADLTLAGFVGMAGQYLDAIGFLLEEGPPSATPPPALVQLGPSGGHPSSDTPFNYQPIPDGAQIIGFTIWPGNLINAIQLYYTGQSIPSASYTPQGGSNLSPKPVTITFSEDEYIESISGRYGESVDSINFTTNVKTYSFGGTGGDVVYNYEVPPGYDFVGIWGWAGKYIDAIGFVVRRSQ